MTTAEGDITAVEGDITTLQDRVSDAEEDIDDTLTGLALAQDVIGTLAWITAHSKVTTDTTPVSGTVYYIKNQDGTFTLVTDTEGKNPASEGWYVMDEAMESFIMAHLALTERGLWVLPSGYGTATDEQYAPNYKVLLSPEGMTVYDGTGTAVVTYGSTISFGSDRGFAIGNKNGTNYIYFNPTTQSITIGGDVSIGSSKTLSELMAEVAGKLDEVDVSVTQTSTGADITINGDTVSLANGADGADGEDAVLVNIHSSNGMAFKNDAVDTTLTVTIYYGDTVITNQSGLTSAFGTGSYLQWKARLYGESEYHTIPSSDTRLSDDGFTFDLSPSDVNVQAVFTVEIIVPD